MVPPPPTSRVNDYAGLLAPAQTERLERLLAERERATGTQMVIAVFRSLEGESLEDFSIRLAERWRIGRKGLDDGVILLVFVAERRVRLDVGYGLEPRIPDAVAGRIIGEAVAPRFREGRYAEGLEAAVAAVYGRLESGRAGGAGKARRGPDVATLATLAVLAVIVGFVVMSQLGAARRRGYTATRGGWSAPRDVYRSGWGWGGGHRGGGGGFSGGGGGFSGGGGSFGGGGASGSW
ncbi:MAG TPA: TPM domain-containing protein [Methylomirabilota bacterium]|nr:TPM domain-containing protein [Methylomirabilota bacterium]